MPDKDSQLILEVRDLDYCIDDKYILQQISFSARKGECIGIIGPNGAGKSTLLRCIRGMNSIAAGTVFVAGHPVKSMGEKELARKIAYMQQNVFLDFGFTALEIVLTGRYPYLNWWQGEQDEDYRIARQAMSFTGVQRLEKSAVNRVSGGERQRILFAKVLTQDTEILFLDEPTANLDLVYQEEIFRYCQAVCRRGKTVVVVAHDLRMAAKFCTRLILLAQGRILADGTPEEVITQENLIAAYGLHAAVFNNRVTGNLDLYTYSAAAAVSPKEKVHVIGGGGSAGEIIRRLHEAGYVLTSGVLHEGDTDADVCLAFDVDAVLCKPFSPIDDNAAGDNRARIAAADWTVLTSIHYGKLNMDNLAAAFAAPKLIVLEDQPIDARDCTGGQAVQLYYELVKQPQVEVMTTEGFIDKILESEK